MEETFCVGFNPSHSNNYTKHYYEITISLAPLHTRNCLFPHNLSCHIMASSVNLLHSVNIGNLKWYKFEEKPIYGGGGEGVVGWEKSGWEAVHEGRAPEVWHAAPNQGKGQLILLFLYVGDYLMYFCIDKLGSTLSLVSLKVVIVVVALLINLFPLFDHF